MKKKIIIGLIILLIGFLLYKGYIYTTYYFTKGEIIKYEEIMIDEPDTKGVYEYKDISFDFIFSTETPIITEGEVFTTYKTDEITIIIGTDDNKIGINEILKTDELGFSTLLEKYNINNDFDLMLHFIKKDYQSYNFLTSINKIKEANKFNTYIAYFSKEEILLTNGYIESKVDNFSGTRISFNYKDKVYNFIIKENNILNQNDVINFIKSINLN